jgi:hypothetical protein
MCSVNFRGTVLRRKGSIIAFEFLTTVLMKSSFPWVIMPCTVESQPVQAQRISQAGNSSWITVSCRFYA